MDETVHFVVAQPDETVIPEVMGAANEGNIMALALGKAVFIDKDGTLIRDVPYNVDPRGCDLLRALA